MAIHRIATAQAEMTSFPGTMSTDTRFFDAARVEKCYKMPPGSSGFLDFEEPTGNIIWTHATYGHDTSVNGTSNFNTSKVFSVKDSNGDEIAFCRVVGLTMTFGVVGDTTSESAGVSISLNTNVMVDMQIDVDGSTDITLNAYINSGLQFSATVANTGGRGKGTRLEFNNTKTDGFEHNKYYSEFIVADEDTRGWRLREFKPQSLGVYQQWDGTVSSVADASLATGISTDTADERMSFGLRNLDNIDDGDIINRVVVQTFGQRGASGLTSINHFFRYDDGTVEDSSDISLGLFGDWYVEEFEDNPDTATAWDPADLAGIQLGVRART